MTFFLIFARLYPVSPRCGVTFLKSSWRFYDSRTNKISLTRLLTYFQHAIINQSRPSLLQLRLINFRLLHLSLKCVCVWSEVTLLKVTTTKTVDLLLNGITEDVQDQSKVPRARRCAGHGGGIVVVITRGGNTECQNGRVQLGKHDGQKQRHSDWHLPHSQHTPPAVGIRRQGVLNIVHAFCLHPFTL